MSSRTKKIIGVIVAIIILLLLLLLLWLASQQPPTAVNIVEEPVREPTPIGSLNTDTSNKPPLLETVDQAQPEPDTEEPDVRASLRSLASAFAERYGSYSNQGDYENLEELQALMTDSLAAKTQRSIDQARDEGLVGAAYVGVTSRAINTTISNLNEDTGIATVTVNTQREKSTSQGSSIYYQKLELDFVREGEIWKVESATWLEEGA